ncbi:MAG: bifunctional diaminohydroxyphosphoribosylaminopyrimidine deaminase/5-amino-6-(5-phosphoribosylamino)uracil reductase RibD [Alphaproteobacteria bacterium]|nr:bifunctional diaminohydroxyphosphoribosylaminopyrimidine deaminase/5-amino-6-(5-phosphoribosylamino)uracil reductase RibD [Alphaproteobacteria bacterium]
MQMALQLAQRGLGDVWPNPAVGCVLVNSANHIVGRGWTQSGGRPHAETEALQRAGSAARGATAYVTLEPCAHQGVTGPCAVALHQAGVARVVSAMEDPDRRVSGQGHAMLRAAGVDVVTSMLADKARVINVGFLNRVSRGRPSVTLKLATTLDGKIALRNGASQWITNEASRRAAHLLRSRHDAVMAGIGTVLADDPELTCRLAGIKRSRFVRVVADAEARLPPRSKLATSAKDVAVWLLCAGDADSARQAALVKQGVRILHVPRSDGGVDLAKAFATLGGEGLTRVLVEGGATLAAGLLKDGLVDQLVQFRAPSVIGGDGLAAIGALDVTSLKRMPRFRPIDTLRLGEDVLETYEPAP